MTWIAVPRWPRWPVAIITYGCGHTETRFAAQDQQIFICTICEGIGYYLARCDVPWEPYRAR